jgi:RNAse (barnase) inhibitor barstar
MSTPALDTLLAQCRRPEGPAVIEARTLSVEEAGRLAALLDDHDIQAQVIDGAQLGGKADLLREVATALDFPSHFGHNWDALIDCLSDMSWLPARGYVLILVHAEALRSADARAHETLLEVADEVAERWHEYDAEVVFKLVRGAKG